MAADLIAVLVARRPRVMFDRRNGFPYGWSVWLRQGWTPAAATAFNVNDVLAAAPPWRPRTLGVARLPYWLALLQLLWWQGDERPPIDQRWMRRFAALFSAGLHLLFAVFLLWVALVRSHVPPPPGAQAGARVQVEYVGNGAGETGGGTPQAATADTATAAQAEPVARSTQRNGAQHPPSQPPQPQTQPPPQQQAVDTQVAAMPAQASNPPPEAAQALPEPAPDAQADQPLQVTEVATPTTDFTLPPPTLKTPDIHARDLQVRERNIETVTEPAPQVQALPTPVIAVKESSLPQMQVRERSIEPVTEPTPQVQSLPTPAVAVKEPSLPQMQVRERSIEPVTEPAPQVQTLPEPDITAKEPSLPQMQMRERQMADVAKTAPTPATGAATAATQNAQAAAPLGRAATDTAPPGDHDGAGPKPQDHSGGWATPARSDDWGAAQRQVPGGAAGQERALFNGDGSVKLAGDGGQERAQASSRGAPGSDSDGWSREQIDRAGTWLKRPPYDYTPTSFDKYWVPNESLLAEWVRKGIKKIEIPIPGTHTRISCVISMLQFGGGCGLDNPNMQEQPAGARPPPDIPFKKELQEDNGSVR